MTERVVLCEDAVDWLRHQDQLVKTSFVASLPDISEFPHFTLPEWKEWFTQTAQLILSRTSEDGVSIFYQSDIKHEGTWVDKGYLCQKAAETLGHELLWHKIICRSPAGTTTFGRPSYSHMLCFSKQHKSVVSQSSADVIPDLGEKTWTRGMGLEACLIAAKYIATQTTSTTLVNPFCGEGSMLAAANALGVGAIGIERSPKRAQKAKELHLSLENKKWAFGGSHD
jgi:hypothetical protein